MEPLIRVILFIIPLLCGAFCAKRLNFIHGLLVAIAWFFVIGGAAILITEHLPLDNALAEFVSKYLYYIYLVPLTMINDITYLLDGHVPDSFISNISIVYIVVPIVVVIVSSIISRIFRRRKS